MSDDVIVVNIDIADDLMDQFSRDLGLEHTEEGAWLPPAMGTGEKARVEVFPDGMEFYHFGNAQFARPIQMNTVNDVDSEWFLIHINLSSIKQRKFVAGRKIDFQMLLPIGLLIYGPGLDIRTRIPPGVDSEVASIRFNRQVLRAYFDDPDDCFDTRKNLVCEDLDHALQRLLEQAIAAIGDRMLCHSRVLTFLSRLFAKLRAHENTADTSRLRANDVDGLFRAAAALRDPLSEEVPSIEELARIANMSATKLKSSFRQLFGSPPKQYRNKIRMEFAKDALESGERTPSEVSYLLGYSHPSNFTAAYKKYFGELPSARSGKALRH